MTAAAWSVLLITALATLPNARHPGELTGDMNKDVMDAAASGNIKTLTKLLGDGGSVHIMNEFGETPLHVAALSKRYKMLKFLLDHGANASAVTDGTYEGHKTRVHRSVLEWWVVHCDVAPIKLLVEAGADLSFEDEEGFTVLARAKRAGKRCDRVVDYIEEILQNDAASSSKDDL
eukprot:m.96644 g.96644  ORF g.96644 m.96644 type:complete len:176 (+) comp10177_c0_seq3:186-713(+)